MLKLLLTEPESEAVREAVAREDTVIVSALTELETAAQLRAGRLGGAFGLRRYRAYLAQLEAFREMEPFRFAPLSGTVFQTALRQHDRDAHVHCRSLDRLHLAAMEELGLRRLMTNDAAQSTAAQGLGYEVLLPGHASHTM